MWNGLSRPKTTWMEEERGGKHHERKSQATRCDFFFHQLFAFSVSILWYRGRGVDGFWWWSMVDAALVMVVL